MEELKVKEFLLVKDAVVLLNSSRQMIYNLINTGKLHATNIQKKKTLVPRSEIDKLIYQEPVVPMAAKKKAKPPKSNDFYSIGEAEVVIAINGQVIRSCFEKWRKGGNQTGLSTM